MQLVVVDPVEVCDLVNEGDVYFVAQFVEALAHGQQGLAVEDNAVGHLAEAVLVPFGEGDAVVESERVECAVFGAILNNKNDVVEPVDHVVGQAIEFIDDETLEFGVIKLQHSLSMPRASGSQSYSARTMAPHRKIVAPHRTKSCQDTGVQQRDCRCARFILLPCERERQRHMPRRCTPVARTAAASVLFLSLGLGLTGCAGLSSVIGIDPVTETTAPDANALVLDSEFTDMGSVHPKIMLADQLELELDMWTEQKTREWSTDSDKLFSFVISVYDRAVSADASFDSKRHVYMSNIAVTSTTQSVTGSSSSAFSLNADPVMLTLDPEALASEDGLLITSPKGGFQLESNRIGALPSDTTGITLDFAMTIASESEAGSGSYGTETVHQLIPVGIFPPV